MVKSHQALYQPLHHPSADIFVENFVIKKNTKHLFENPQHTLRRLKRKRPRFEEPNYNKFEDYQCLEAPH